MSIRDNISQMARTASASTSTSSASATAAPLSVRSFARKCACAPNQVLRWIKLGVIAAGWQSHPGQPRMRAIPADTPCPPRVGSGHITPELRRIRAERRAAKAPVPAPARKSRAK